MAFEGLIAKNIPGLLRTVAPHVPQLLSGIAERFGRDTREIKETLSAEIAALRQSHATLLASTQRQEEAAAELREHLLQVERKLDRLAEGQQAAAQDLEALRSLTQTGPANLRTPLVLTMFFALLACGLGVAQLLLHR